MTTAFPPFNNCTVAVIGLGYVGLPLASEFAKPQVCRRTGDQLHRRVIGFDINSQRLEELCQGIDRTNEISAEELHAAQLLEFTSDPALLKDADVFVVTVPTPIDSTKRPDLTPLEAASATVGCALKQRISRTTPVVIYESTVYPGATEEVCVPILERESGLQFNKEFFCGYSPERINPGDKHHKLADIIKVTSGSTHEASLWVDNLYGSIISAGTHIASSLKVAEAAKVIENTQRDLNIALINELSIIFQKIGIDTIEVLEASETKWNFLSFRPGLVGGHCIGVDPYYLTYKAQSLGYYPDVVLAGRRINDGMARQIVQQVVVQLSNKSSPISTVNLLLMGITFKQNCPDLRNSKVVDLYNELKLYGVNVFVHDPLANENEAQLTYGSAFLNDSLPISRKFDCIIVAVAHDSYRSLTIADWKSMCSPSSVIFDVKGFLPRELNATRM